MHTIVVDLGYGDAGKGAVVDRLCSADPVRAVVRFNGGAQAAHNVVTPDGRHHTFAQFGSGTLHGTPTYLSRFMLVDPLALAAEADHLAALGVRDPLALLTVDRDAALTTPYHAAANRLREQARGGERHGSCGMGIGETAAYALAHPEDAPRVGDCVSRPRLLRKLALLRDRLSDELGRLPAPPVEHCADAFAAFARAVTLAGDGHLARLLADGPVVFEGRRVSSSTSGTASTRTRHGRPPPSPTPRRCWPRRAARARRCGSASCARTPPGTVPARSSPRTRNWPGNCRNRTTVTAAGRAPSAPGTSTRWRTPTPSRSAGEWTRWPSPTSTPPPAVPDCGSPAPTAWTAGSSNTCRPAPPAISGGRPR
ncbi:adenylosuccinate synthetase [Streptomyces sp. RKAG293]|nr:adenylosuccinate synthetase [Streptomyces sp. RKAG293]